jgi:hypothetical protein
MRGGSWSSWAHGIEYGFPSTLDELRPGIDSPAHASEQTFRRLAGHGPMFLGPGLRPELYVLKGCGPTNRGRQMLASSLAKRGRRQAEGFKS